MQEHIPLKKISTFSTWLSKKVYHDKTKIILKDVLPVAGIDVSPGAIEELQSVNEKCKGTTEKLQDTPEELRTVNPELNSPNERLNHAMLYTKAIFATIHVPLLVLSQNFRIKHASKSFYKTFSIAEEEAIGKNLFDLQNKQWNIPGLQNQLLRIHTENESFPEWEITHTFPFLGERTICFNAQPFLKENGENCVLLALDDITKRKKLEKADKKSLEDLKKVLENIPQITLTASADGTITYFNQFFLDYSGMTFAQALKQGWEPVIKPEMLDEVKKAWTDGIATGKDFDIELELKKKKENVYRWHLYRASAIRNDEGIISSWVMAATDLHDQKSKEQAKDEFMSIASHELKTPLTSAKAFLQLLQLSMDETNNKDLMYAQKAGESIDRLNILISELLDVNKIQNGKLSLNITTFNFNEMISAAMEGFQYTSPAHIIIKKGEIPQEITGDKERLQQVVVNLLSNAIKYSPEGKKVMLQMMLKNGEVTVSIKDRGIGIDRENLWKIFERYYREEERTIHFQGLGIGLYISYDIIQRHKGKLWAQRNGGRGTTFYFTLPV
jgi:two-component system, chemotaxis family, CheB/CheR fusion protein